MGYWDGVGANLLLIGSWCATDSGGEVSRERCYGSALWEEGDYILRSRLVLVMQGCSDYTVGLRGYSLVIEAVGFQGNNIPG